jgi:SAM-dependent methyltransferase
MSQLDTATFRQLLSRGDDPHRPSLENRVAFQWEARLDTLGYRSNALRDDAILRFAAEALAAVKRPATVVELGCAYGNLLFMLDAYTGHDAAVHFVGVDVDEPALDYGQAFTRGIDGYQTCEFVVHDVSTDLPIPDGSVAVVIAADVLEHLTDVGATLREIRRILAPRGTLIISSPLADSLFKRLARFARRASRGRTDRAYYGGKNAELDERGQPIMEVRAGHEHISEMRYADLIDLVQRTGFVIDAQQLAPVMSGSHWFDEHPWLLTGLFALEALHARLARPSWAHGIVLHARKTA